MLSIRVASPVFYDERLKGWLKSLFEVRLEVQVKFR